MSDNLWLKKIEENPGHSEWYIDRFRAMAAEGKDLNGEARLIDAMADRNARILDAGCGPGRTAGRLHELGHRVVGVDLDPVLIAAAEADHPGPTWLVGDLADIDLDGNDDLAGFRDDAGVVRFDLIVSAGNVVAFFDPAKRQAALKNLAQHLASDGRIVIGFGGDRGYTYDEFFSDVAAVGLNVQSRFSTWEIRPFEDNAEFLVAVLAH